MKTCSKCGELKGFDCFHRGSAYKDGVKNVCKSCYADYHKSRYVSKKTPEYYEAKAAALAIKKAEKLAIVAEKARLKVLDMLIKDAEKKKKKAEYNRKYRLEHPGCRRIEKKNRKLKVRASGRLSPSIVDRLLKFQRGKCPICRVELAGQFHIDHVIPIALNGTNTDDNVQLLCPSCNLSKGAKHPVEFMQSLGRLI